MLNQKLHLIGRPDNKWGDLALSFLLLSSIICFLSVKSWTNTCLFLLLIPSLLYIKKSFLYTFQSEEKKQVILIFLALSLPVIAVFISQLGRQDWLFRSYDGPARPLFSILIFFLLVFKRVNFSHLIGLSSPLALFVTAGSIYLNPEALDIWFGRYATYFVDPNTFGTYAVVLTSFCLFHLDVSFKSSKRWFCYQLFGFLIGLFLILGSGTRGSWIAIPAIGVIWIVFNYRKISISFAYISLITVIISGITATIFFPLTIVRFMGGVNEIIHWFDNSALDTSTGLRLSIWKISWQLFLHHPFFGYGNQGFVSYLNEPWFSSTATDAAKQIMICCGPHNEFISSTLRSGIAGSFAVVSMLLIPFVLFARNAYSSDSEVAMASHLGLAFISCIAISSISTEVFHLKYTSSFYGIMIAGLTAQIFSHKI